jgi:hypothetical protein
MTDTCKICWSVDDNEVLLSPCACTGTMKFVHASCLRAWMSVKNSGQCDICLTQLPFQPPAIEGLCQMNLQVLRRQEELPLSLKFAIAGMWVYTGLVLMVPLFICLLEGKVP